MANARGKRPVRGSGGKVLVRCWFYEGGRGSECPSPSSCRYVNPWEPEWNTCRSAQKAIRCNRFDLDGNPIHNGCRQGNECRFLHPSDAGWSDATTAASLTPPAPPAPAPVPSSSSSSTPNKPAPRRHYKRCRYFNEKGERRWGGCKAGLACSFLHPSDPGWANLVSHQAARCQNYDANGNPVRGGCPHLTSCAHIHPNDPEWKDIFKRTYVDDDTIGESSRARGRSTSRRRFGDGVFQRRFPSPDRPYRRRRSPNPLSYGRQRSPSPSATSSLRYMREHSRERERRSSSPLLNHRSYYPQESRFRSPRDRSSPLTPRYTYSPRYRSRSPSAILLSRENDHLSSSGINLDAPEFTITNLQNEDYYAAVTRRLIGGENILQQAETESRIIDNELVWDALRSLAELFPHDLSMLNMAKSTYNHLISMSDTEYQNSVEDLIKNMVTLQAALQQYHESKVKDDAEPALPIVHRRTVELYNRTQMIVPLLNSIKNSVLRTAPTEMSETETVKGDAMEVDELSPKSAASPTASGPGGFWNALKSMLGFG
ncbi:hypothetical protein DACRYDRAFT_25578 [Dacryopinax primogenitus]|uniref:C3H1-type domain-containing protein n=1 Tax=Dacryopinax primogenitus (strain DJM 731) TaxID=1858805 RepID=M5FYR2_DACPD|nr:uncharacterized protein DACRYDRAFT_25578 [Dacryopinax primogenitus]EJT96642.1 hypothetical protein DACRYDRAFT_25578 [Dacryopinax primogenitus]